MPRRVRAATNGRDAWRDLRDSIVTAAGGPVTKARASEREIPGLTDEILAEALVAVLGDEPEAGVFVETPRGAEHAVRPERDFPVARAPGEPDAFTDQPAADAQPAPP